MAFDPSYFHRYNVIDTCSVWNILASNTLYRAARNAGIEFLCTLFVIYECLNKPRKRITPCELTLQNTLKLARQKGEFKSYHLDIDDLQDVELLRNRKNLGMGELSSIALARKISQAFLSDDKKAIRLAEDVMSGVKPQTTSHLFGWLFFHRHLVDSDKDQIIDEQEQNERNLREQFENAYLEAMRCMIMNRKQKED